MANQVLYGFVGLQDQFNERVNSIGEEVVNDAIMLTLEKHNQMINDMLGVFSTPTTFGQTNFTSIASSRLQPMDENGRPRPIKPSKYTVAFPLKMAGVGLGENFVAAAKMTVRHANNLIAGVLLSDINWMRSQILAALFDNAGWTFNDPDLGDLAVKGLANGDAVTYVRTGTLAPSADTHYLAQANAIDDDNNPFPGIYDELTEHIENGGEVVCFIPTDMKSAVTALAGFIPVSDSQIRYGSATDVLTGTLGLAVPGMLIGRVDQCYVVEWKSLPSNYIVGVTTEGDSPLAQRQDEEAELNGLVLLNREDAPWYERLWYRRAGFGANNRVGAVVKRIGNGSYAVPTGYAQPLP